MTGVYIHVPFCVQKCPYCDFYSVKSQDNLQQQYADAVCEEILSYPQNTKCDTIYFGGGTPGILKPQLFEKILNTLYNHFDIDRNAEISLETNPAVIDKKGFADLKSLGFNRVSIGVQSLNDDDLKLLGRLHDAKGAVNAVCDAYSAGFENISIDFMMCLPNQSAEKFINNLEKAKNLPIKHISAYMLKIEENTPFANQNLILPDDDLSAEIYIKSAEYLENIGFEHYEISNFAELGFECRHNLKYWQLEEYIGIGPAAHSFYQNKRYAKQKSLTDFLQNPCKTYFTDENCNALEEKIMLNLRLKSGFDTNILDDEKQKAVLNRADIFEKHGLMQVKNGIICLTKQGFLVSNSIISDIIYNL